MNGGFGAVRGDTQQTVYGIAGQTRITAHSVLEYRIAGTTRAREIRTVGFTGERMAEMQFERCMEWATGVAEDCECCWIFTDRRLVPLPIYLWDKRLPRLVLGLAPRFHGEKG